MKNYIWIKIWTCTMIYVHLTTAATDNSTPNSERSKRSFAFGFSNPIFSRVFNPYDDRPLAAKFFGDDYTPSSSYASNFGPSQYHSNHWNYDSWSDDDDASEENYQENYQEEKPQIYGNGGWTGSGVKFLSKPYPPHIDVLKKPKVDHTTEKVQLEFTTPKGEYIFKSLPHYEIAKPFRTPEEVRKLHNTKITISPFKLKVLPVKKPTMEYIFNLLPHYERREIFKTFPPTTLVVKKTVGHEKNEKNVLDQTHYIFSSNEYKRPTESFKLYDLKHHTNFQRNVTNKMQIPISKINKPSEYHFKDLPLYDINVKFNEKQLNEAKAGKVSQNHKQDSSVLLPNIETKTIFDKKRKEYVTNIVNKSPSTTNESKFTFVLPNYTIKETFNDKLKDAKPFTSKPHILFEESVKKLTAPFQSSLLLPKLETGINFSGDKKNDILESEIRLATNKNTFNLGTQAATEPIHEKSGQVKISSKISDRYIPHRTKVIKSYSPFLSLPAVVIYQRFNDEITPTEKNLANNVPSVKEATFIPKITGFSAESTQNTIEDKYSKEVPQGLPSMTTNHQFSISQLSSNPSKQSTHNQKLEFAKIKSVSKRPITESIFPKSLVSETNPMINLLEALINEFPPFENEDTEKVPQTKTDNNKVVNTYNINHDSVVPLEVPKRKPSQFRSIKQPSASFILRNHPKSEITPAPVTERPVVDNRINFNPNIPQSILETLSQNKNNPSEIPRNRYITQSVIIKPIEENLQKPQFSSSRIMKNWESKSVHDVIKPSRNNAGAEIKDEKKHHEDLEEKPAPSPMNSLDPKVLKVHHVRRKPPTSIEFSSVESNEVSDQKELRRPLIQQNQYATPQKLFKKEKITNVSHKRVRVDMKRLPAEKLINFRSLPYYNNKGTSFRKEMVYKIVGDEENMRVQKEEMKQPFVSDNIVKVNDLGEISIGDIPLEKDKIWDSKKRVLVNSYGETMQ